MPLDIQAQILLDIARAEGLPPINQMGLAEARARAAKALTYPGSAPPVFQVRDCSVPRSGGIIALRQYRPSVAEFLPAVFFFHSGGWVLGGLDTHDHICRALASQSGCLIIAVDYRLAPEHPYPAAVDDARAAVSWLHEKAEHFGIDQNRIGVAGDSAGGTIAAVVSQITLEMDGPKLACQALIYPVMDHWTIGTESYRKHGIGYSLTSESMRWFWEQYLPEPADRINPRACPLQANGFNNLPPTLVLTAEFDPLCDEAEEYVRRLRESSVPVQCSRYDGMMHGFLTHFPVLDKGRLGLAEMAAFLRAHLHDC
jgi:acetyl esterase